MEGAMKAIAQPSESRTRETRSTTITEHKLFYYSYVSFTKARLPLLKVAALYFDKLSFLDSIGASLVGIGVNYATQEVVKQLREVGILQTAMPSVLHLTILEGTNHANTNL
jgi:hypothetical protein